MEEGTKPLKMEHNFCRNPKQGLVLIGLSSVSHDLLREQLAGFVNTKREAAMSPVS